jgi:N-methylhydantoinase A
VPVRAAFNALHEQRYAHHSSTESVEIINVRLVALGRRDKLVLPPLAKGDAVAPTELRSVRFDEQYSATECPVYSREDLPPGATFSGPALVSEYGSTTVLFPGDDLAVAATGELIISLRPTRRDA